MEKRSHLGFHPYAPAAVLRVTGEDSAVFLQGQFSQELRRTSERAAAYGLWLTHKGKVLADSFVLRETSQRFWVVSPFSPAAVIRERLESYVVADDVLIDDVTDDYEAVAVLGLEAAAWLPAHTGLSVPLADSFSMHGADGAETFLFRGRRDHGETWEWLRRKTSASALPPSDLVPRWSEAEMERLRIDAGIPRVPVDVGQGDLPQEGGADFETAAISYSKGCYLGQEVMARLHAMGQVRRRLLRVRGKGKTPDSLPVALLAGGKKIGELRSAIAAEPDGAGLLGLAMVSLVGLDLNAPVVAAGQEDSLLRFDAVQP